MSSKKLSIYSKNLIHRKISVPIDLIGSNLINIIKLCKGHIFIANNKSFQYLDLEIFKSL